MRDMKNINRRKVLKKTISAGGLATASIPTVTAAQEYDAAGEHVQDVLKTSYIQTLQDAVGEFEVLSVEEKQVQVGATTITGTIIKTEIGDINYLISEGNKVAQLKLADLTEKPKLRQRLPVEYRNVPAETDVILEANPSVHLIRSVTDREMELLKQAVGTGKDIATAVYNDRIDKYQITTGDTSNPQMMQKYYVDAVGGARPKPAQDAEIPVSIQGGCTTQSCGSCVLWGASRVGCYISCGTGNVVGCLYCLGVNTAGSFVAFPACDECGDTCL